MKNFVDDVVAWLMLIGVAIVAIPFIVIIKLIDLLAGDISGDYLLK